MIQATPILIKLAPYNEGRLSSNLIHANTQNPKAVETPRMMMTIHSRVLKWYVNMWFSAFKISNMKVMGYWLVVEVFENVGYQFKSWLENLHSREWKPHMRSLEAYYVISKWYYTHHAHGFQELVLEVLYPILTTRTWVSISDGRVPGLWGSNQ